jgi:hypothetical protein
LGDIFGPLGETLFWMAALDDTLRGILKAPTKRPETPILLGDLFPV